MPEPHPGPGQPARASAGSPVSPATETTDEPDTVTETDNVTDVPESNSTPDAADGGGANSGSTAEPAERHGSTTAAEPTEPVVAGEPRDLATVVSPWTGSAPVPPPAPRKRRWLASQQITGSPEPPDATLNLPTAERELLEGQTPVDPWADADAWENDLDHHHSLPPPLPYPAHPAHPGPPAYSGPAHPAQPGPPAFSGPPAHQPPPAYSPPAATPTPRVPVPPAPPPDWRPPKGYVAVPVRRRRRWPWFLLLTLLCCCGCPGWFGRPMWQQYPARAVVPAEVADLTLRDDQASRRATQRLEADVRATHTLAEQTFAGVYSAPGNKQVTVFGAIGFRFTPEDDVTAEAARLTDVYDLTEVRAMPGGERGESRRCGVGRSAGRSLVLCSWADHGSLGTGLFTGRSVSDSADLLTHLRTSMIIRG